MKMHLRRMISPVMTLALIPALSMCGGDGGTSAPVPTKLAFQVQPPATVAAGAVLAPPISVAIQDVNNATVNASSATVTLTLNGGTGLGGTTTVAAVNGIATFANITISQLGAGLTLTASSGTLTAATSSTITVTAGAASALAVTVAPSNATAGSAITPAIQVTIRDAGGNTVTSSTANVTLAITPGSGTAGAILSGTATQAAVNGVATFTGLSIDKSGTYTLTATSAGLTNAVTAGFTIAAAAPSKLGFTVQPTSVSVGASITPAVKVAIQDAAGNTVTTSTANVTIAITPGTGTGGAVLGGTLTQAAVAGVATFGNLSVNTLGTGYTLTATSAGLTNAVSGPFDVATALLTITKYVGDGQTALVGFATNIRPGVVVTDGSGPVAGIPVTFAVTGGGGSITGTATVNTNAQGIAQTGGWTVGAAAGANTMTATGSGAFSGSNAVTFAATAQTRQYNIEIRNIGPAFSPATQAAFNAAESQWQSVIYGELSDVPFNITNVCGLGTNMNETIDDIVILALFDSIDGPGQILGSAGACFVRNSNGLPVVGAMRFDTADMGSLTAAQVNAVIMHEMGHVLGFSSGIFNLSGRTCAQLLSTGNAGAVTSQDTHFNCTQAGGTNNATALFDSIGGTLYTHGNKIPLENCTGLSPGNTATCGPSTYNSHWRESEFVDELMTGYLDNGINGNKMSVVTIAALQDQGYVTNFAAAQSYVHVFSVPAAGTGGRSAPIDLRDDFLNVPLSVVDDRSGRVLRVIPKR